MSYVIDLKSSNSARSELLDWIISNEQNKRQEQSAQRIKAVSEADIDGIRYDRLLARWELEAAFRCVYESYVRTGLMQENFTGLRVIPHQLLPTTEVLAAFQQHEVVSTLSLVRDGDLGLPLEKLYQDEVQERRRSGLNLAEVSCLADRRTQSRNGFRILFRLMCLVIQTASQRGVDELLIAVHPRHARFYQRRFAFHAIGDIKSYDLVKGNPAILLSLDLISLPAQEAAVYERIFANPLPKHLRQTAAIPADVCQHFQVALHDVSASKSVNDCRTDFDLIG